MQDEPRVRASGPTDRVALACFVGYAVLAGANAVGIRFTNRELDPLWGAGLRFSMAAVLLIAVALAMRLQWPRRRALAGALVYGALGFGGAYGLAYYALVHLHAGFGQIVLALVPLLTLLLAVAQRQERMRASGLTGGLISLAGILVMSQAVLDADVPLLALLAAIGSALCVAQASVVVRGFPPVHPVLMNAVGMGFGALLLLAGSLALAEAHVLPERGETWRALAYLVVCGSVLVFVLYLATLRRWPASRATYGFVVIPFVTVLLSVWLDDEPLGWELLLGGPLVLVGVYVGALRPGASTSEDPHQGDRS